MRGNTFGNALTVTVGGESHGPEITAMVDGVPAGLPIHPAVIQADLDRRRPGQNEFTTPRDESDLVRITSGVYQGESTGAPITMAIPSKNTRGQDYAGIKHLYRPGHADVTYDLKYGRRDPNGGGRSSFRVMAGVVAAGAVARQIIPEVQIVSFVDQIGDVRAKLDQIPTLDAVEASPVRCPDPEASEAMQALIREVGAAGDSIGGSLGFVVSNVKAGLGEPIFDKVNARLAAALLAINATTGVEFGSGFQAATMRGSQYNDQIAAKLPQEIVTTSNHGGGTQGGITNGMPITGRVSFRPTSSIALPQRTVDVEGQPATISTEGRHDPCVLPRAVPAVEAMIALVLADFHLRRQMDR